MLLACEIIINPTANLSVLNKLLAKAISASEHSQPPNKIGSKYIKQTEIFKN